MDSASARSKNCCGLDSRPSLSASIRRPYQLIVNTTIRARWDVGFGVGFKSTAYSLHCLREEKTTQPLLSASGLLTWSGGPHPRPTSYHRRRFWQHHRTLKSG